MASVAPIIKIFDEADRIKDTWNVEDIDVHNADQFESNPLVIYVWNNKGGDSNVPDLHGTYITTKNIQGDDINEQAVTDKWVQACVDSLASLDDSGGKKFTQIGGSSNVAPICAQGNLTDDEKNDRVIKGTTNIGDKNNDYANYAKITLKVVPDINAIPGIHYFKIRIAGYYM